MAKSTSLGTPKPGYEPWAGIWQSLESENEKALARDYQVLAKGFSGKRAHALARRVSRGDAPF